MRLPHCEYPVGRTWAAFLIVEPAQANRTLQIEFGYVPCLSFDDLCDGVVTSLDTLARELLGAFGTGEVGVPQPAQSLSSRIRRVSDDVAPPAAQDAVFDGSSTPPRINKLA